MDKRFLFIGEINFKLCLSSNKDNSFKVTSYKPFKNYNEIKDVGTLKPSSVLTFVAWSKYFVYTLNKACNIISV